MQMDQQYGTHEADLAQGVPTRPESQLANHPVVYTSELIFSVCRPLQMTFTTKKTQLYFSWVRCHQGRYIAARRSCFCLLALVTVLALLLYHAPNVFWQSLDAEQWLAVRQMGDYGPLCDHSCSLNWALLFHNLNVLFSISHLCYSNPNFHLSSRKWKHFFSKNTWTCSKVLINCSRWEAGERCGRHIMKAWRNRSLTDEKEIDKKSLYCLLIRNKTSTLEQKHNMNLKQLNFPT